MVCNVEETMKALQSPQDFEGWFRASATLGRTLVSSPTTGAVANCA